MGGDGFTASNGIGLFDRGGLDADLADVAGEDVRQRGADGWDVRSEFWLLGEDDGVEVAKAPRSNAVIRKHVAEQSRAVCASIGFVRVRKPLSDVPQRECAENGIGDRMQEHVRVGVAEQAAVPWDLHSPKHEFAVIADSVQVVSMSDSDHVSPTDYRIESYRLLPSLSGYIGFSRNQHLRDSIFYHREHRDHRGKNFSCGTWGRLEV